MSFLKNLLGKEDQKINSYADFWSWFQSNEKSFHKVIKNHRNIEKNFFDKISPKLAELKDGFFYLAGMLDDNTAELVLTADGKVRDFVFVEELVAAAPEISGWKFTAHKQPLDINNVQINMGEYEFHKDNLSFFPIENREYPDEIEITIVHDDLDDSNREAITNGVYIFLDNFLGELNFATVIDFLNVDGKQGDNQELVPIKKLKDYLTWRQKEFVEKYEGVRHDTENDNYNALEAETENGSVLLAVVNADLIRWDSKASHPWLLKIEVKFNGADDGMPDDETYAMMDAFEGEINATLRDFEGYLNVGRQTGEGIREIYYACKDFRKSSKTIYGIINKYGDKLEIEYEIIKDKYWRALDRFSGI
jgi:hypothetical protein